jgi:diguanylate cyclase (GGDEF)-like protein
MQETPIARIIYLCRKIDEIACDVYARMADLSDEPDLSKFWRDMSKEEAKHISFWRRTEQIKAFSGMPNIFENPDQIILELEKALSRSRDLLSTCEEEFTLSKAFTLAYRMEFYLLHPAFKMLFHLFRPLADGESPEDDYESHIVRFIDMLSKHGDVTPELELLGETLQRLWKENRELALQATRDDLTEVFNRRGFFAVSVQLAYLAQRNGFMIGVMMVDLDHFKSINDRFGHRTGDILLRRVAGLLSKSLRTSDIVGRYGGEEFIIMLPQINRGATVTVADNILEKLRKSPSEGIPLTISIGVAEGILGKNVQEDFDFLIQKADKALYQAKTSGRDRVVEYLPDDLIPQQSLTDNSKFRS